MAITDLQLQDVIDVIPHSVCVVNTSGVVAAVNTAWRKAAASAEQPAACCVGSEYLKVCDACTGDGEADAGRAASGIREVLAGRRPDFQDLYPCAITPGNRRWFLLHAYPIGEDRDRHAIVVHLDITSLYAELEQSRRQERLLHAMLDGIVDAAIYRVDVAERIITWNTGAERLLGWSKDEAIGMRYEDLFSPEERAAGRPRSRLQQAAADGLVELAEWRTRKDGSRFFARSSLFPLRGEHGELIGYAKVTLDVSALHETELSRERLLRNLEQKNKELDQFVHTVSHELKTPLVTVTGFASHLTADLLSGRTADVSRHAERILQAALRMRTHVDDLLELCQIGRVVHEPQVIDLSRMLDEVLQALRPELEEAPGVRITRRFEAPTVAADPIRIYQVLENLISNAVRYGRGADGCRIEVGSMRDGRATKLFVRDEGQGIAPEHHERIFVLFQHLGAHKNSTGVGLTIVQRIAELHGGRAWVESTPSRGATFFVSIADAMPPGASEHAVPGLAGAAS